MTRAVVFAYHDVGVRCLAVLLAAGVEVPLVITHADDPDENIWFGSVAELARFHGLPVITPARDELPELVSQINALRPDFLFSFYYRYLLSEELLNTASRGALNMHGSLLPKYRGRVPVNWAIIHGERETGASLHYMALRPDSGPLVDQQMTPILPDDTALDVFRKVTWAAELVLYRSLPRLIAGTAPRIPLDLQAGSYFGRRGPADGRIDWRAPAQTVHNLIRAVTRPYPGAFTRLHGQELRIWRSRYTGQPARHPQPCGYGENGRCYADCGDGRRLEILDFDLGGQPVTPARFFARWGEAPIAFEE